MTTNKLAGADILTRYISTKLFKLDSPKKNRLIYHYCPHDIFYKIIESKDLWLTPISNLNDSSEFLWFRNVTRDCIAKKLSCFQKANPNINNSGTDIITALNKLLEDISEIKPNQFIASFSIKSDCLSQFRLYAEDAKGYALGFNVDGFRRKAIPIQFPPSIKETGIYLYPVIYKMKIQKKIVNLQIEEAFKKYQQTNDYKHLNDSLMPLVELAGVFKNPSFHNENEWRLHYIANENSNKIETGNKNIVYDLRYKLKFNPEDNLLEGVTIGSVNPEASEDATKKVSKYLSTQGFKLEPEFNIKKSNSTYRGKLK